MGYVPCRAECRRVPISCVLLAALQHSCKTTGRVDLSIWVQSAEFMAHLGGGALHVPQSIFWQRLDPLSQRTGAYAYEHLLLVQTASC
jgi:hypothetical protein